jgi:sodium/bile acid cotransporter 7
MGMRSTLARHWFLLGLAAAIALAALLPWLGAPDGPLMPQVTVHLAVAAAFLVSGLTLPLDRLRSAAGQWRLHLFIQAFCFALFPALVLPALPLLARLGAPAALTQGFAILACLPTTIASCVIFTRTAHGNEAAALCNSVLGNLLGLALTPLLILLALGTHGEAPVTAVLRQLSLEVLLPIALGQAVRVIAGTNAFHFERLRQVPSMILLYIVFCVFAATFGAPASAGAGPQLLLTIVAVALIHLAVLLIAWGLATACGFSPADRIAALFCSTQKTMALGVPLISILYGHHPQLAWLTLPLIVYHPLQLVLGGVLATRLKTTTPAG